MVRVVELRNENNERIYVRSEEELINVIKGYNIFDRLFDEDHESSLRVITIGRSYLFKSQKEFDSLPEQEDF